MAFAKSFGMQENSPTDSLEPHFEEETDKDDVEIKTVITDPEEFAEDPKLEYLWNKYVVYFRSHKCKCTEVSPEEHL